MESVSKSFPRIRRRKRSLPQPGAAPGTLRPTADRVPTEVHRYWFDADNLEVDQPSAAEVLDQPRRRPEGTTWLDVRGLGDDGFIRDLGETLGLHGLTIEDIVHTHQRPKLEELEGHLYTVLRMVRLLEGGAVDDEQCSLLIFPGLLVTFQERPGDVFEPVRRRLRQGKGRIRSEGADYLAYALIDAIIDHYYPVLDAYADSMDVLDEAVRVNPTAELSRAIHGIRRELRALRRAIWPLREVTAALCRNEVDGVGEAARGAFRDCHDHVVQAMDIIDGTRERAAELADLHLVMTSERTNQVMKVLTIIATIFIPLTFMCGLYGMNFDSEVSPWNMPELKWRYGYPALWAVMLVTLAGMLAFFRKQGWIGKRAV